jgi:hypothetical protein
MSTILPNGLPHGRLTGMSERETGRPDITNMLSSSASRLGTDASVPSARDSAHQYRDDEQTLLSGRFPGD